MDNILEWYLKPFKQYVDFEGRARRKEYWTFTLGNVLISLILGGSAFGIGGGSEFVSMIFSVAIFVPGIAVCVRRLHDTGRSGFWIFILFLPVIGLFILLYFLISDSEPGHNSYGPNPKMAI